TNQLLDDLGYERSNDGRHQTLNRERVRDALRGLERVELRALRFNDQVEPTRRDLFRAPLLYVGHASYNAAESADQPGSTLLERGLPTHLTIELGWYSGVRLPDGRLGNNYALLPTGATYFHEHAHYAATDDALLEFLFLKRSLLRNTAGPITLSRGV